MTFALEAETTGGWCLQEAQLAISGIQVARAIYDTLTVPDGKGDYMPFLAQSVTPSADYKTWTIKLRSGIKFHDGTALDAPGREEQPRRVHRPHRRRSCCSASCSTTTRSSASNVDPMTVEVDTKIPWVSFPSHLYSSGRLGHRGPGPARRQARTASRT